MQPSKAGPGSNDLTVGQVAELAQNHSVALRVRFDTPDRQGRRRSACCFSAGAEQL